MVNQQFAFASLIHEFSQKQPLLFSEAGKNKEKGKKDGKRKSIFVMYGQNVIDRSNNYTYLCNTFSEENKSVIVQYQHKIKHCI